MLLDEIKLSFPEKVAIMDDFMACGDLGRAMLMAALAGWPDES